MTDFLIVGRGLAAAVLAHTFFKQKISFKIIGSVHLSSSSLVAAGIFNPIVFKRLTKSWLADKTIPFLNTFYTECENRSGEKFITQRNIIKPFSEEQEKQLWLKKSKNELADFLDGNIYANPENKYKGCLLPPEFGLVKQAGNLDIRTFLKSTEKIFDADILSEEFDHSGLQIEADKVLYKGIEAKNIIFCEGHVVKNNPFFGWIPLKPVKGEVLTIRSNDLVLHNSILNKNGYLMGLGNNTYLTGATYNWEDLSETPTDNGAQELKQKLTQLITGDYKVIEHKAGVRPASLDRRPIVGSHPNYKNLFVFNGLGTKGVMLAPYFANNFVNFYSQKEVLNKEIDLKRFYHLYKGVG